MTDPTDWMPTPRSPEFAEARGYLESRGLSAESLSQIALLLDDPEVGYHSRVAIVVLFGAWAAREKALREHALGHSDEGQYRAGDIWPGGVAP